MITPAGSAAWWPRYAFAHRAPTAAAVAEAREAGATRILITGSLYLVGDALEPLGEGAG